MKKYYNPKFYNYNSKWLGIIEYRALIFLGIYSWIIYLILGVLNITMIFKIYLAMFCIIPIAIVLIIPIKRESIIDMILSYIRYSTMPKRLFFLITEPDKEIIRKYSKWQNRFYIL